jgi:signal transduction histidine kinase
MRLTVRRRLVIGLLTTWPVGLIYLDWCLFNGNNIVRVSRGHNPICDGSWRSALNGCTAFALPLAWIEIVGFTLIAIGIVVLVTRWVLSPLRGMAGVVGQLGPTSLGLRLRPEGPRDEARQLAEAIDGMLDRVAEGYDAQRRFAANASHELRTPLATQRALIEVSLGSALTAEQLALLSRQLLATNERNEALIEGLLVLAETERGLLAGFPLRLDLLLAATIETLRPAASERGIAIEANLAAVEVNGEQPLLERLASNLVQNAVKYNQPGGWVQVRAMSPATLVVANSGPRVPAEQVGGLFEAFRRASGDRLDHGGGVGLGLTIARSIVTAHRGSIVATANPAGGLTVEVHLPPCAPSERPASLDPAPG